MHINIILDLIIHALGLFVSTKRLTNAQETETQILWESAKANSDAYSLIICVYNHQKCNEKVNISLSYNIIDVYSICTCMMYEMAMRVYSRARRHPPMTQFEFNGRDGGGERG